MKNENKLKLMQNEELKILDLIKSICEENNLRFYMLGGTFLGAIRHKGFIPWDDDGDIGLPRKDYEKFIDLFKKINNDNFEIITLDDEKSNYNFVCKIQSKKVIVKDKSCIEEKVTGAWIDIFPIDGMPKNLIFNRLHKLNMIIHRGMWKLSDSGNIGINKKTRSKLENFIICIGLRLNIGKLFNKKKRLKALDKVLQKYDYDKEELNVNYFGAYKFRETFPKWLYDDVSYYDFESIKLPAPTDYDYYLKQLYGDYMTPPNDNEKDKHGTTLIESEGRKK